MGQMETVRAQALGVWHELRRRALEAPRARTPAALWSRAIVAGRATASALAMWLFMAGFTLDDLHLFRLPTLYVGAAAAAVAFGVAPPIIAGRIVRRAKVDTPARVAATIEAAIIWRRIWLGATILVFVAWLVLFSSNATPRWS